ncbi:MAG: mechanosensitive ion channel [Acidobacteria bacterium]|nr:mechanosensitive ion channel [Acidobacteriota bacterium]
MVFGFLGVAVAGLILLGRVVEWPFLRRLTGVLALVALACWAEWGAVVFSVAGNFRRWIDAGVVVAVGLLIVRGALILLFEWLMEGRLGLGVPRLARDVVGLVVYLLVVAGVLHAVLGVEIKGLLATSAVVTVVIGLALQETLGTLLAGLTLTWEQQLQRGTWVELEGKTGRVEELGWRSLTLRTLLGERLLIPNSTVSRSEIRVLGTGARPAAVPVTLGVSYGVPPDRVKEVLAPVLADLPMAASRPAPQVLVRELGESAILYECRVWTLQPWRKPEITDTVLTRACAALARAGMEIPFPQRTIHVRRDREPEDPGVLARKALASSTLFAGLPDDALDRLAAHSRWLRFAAGEAVIREGEDSRAMYLIAHGTASVLQNGKELAHLGDGELFGEIAFLTGQRRSATIRAAGELTIVEIDGVALAALLERRPDLAEELERRMAMRLEDLGQARMRGESTELEVGILQQLGLRLRRLVSGGHDAGASES